jgi:hypothetical protein
MLPPLKKLGVKSEAKNPVLVAVDVAVEVAAVEKLNGLSFARIGKIGFWAGRSVAVVVAGVAVAVSCAAGAGGV